MKNYQIVTDPILLKGKYFEIIDGKFFDRCAMITHAFFAYSNPKMLVIRCYPDRLIMEYDLLPNEEGKYNLERVHEHIRDFCSSSR